MPMYIVLCLFTWIFCVPLQMWNMASCMYTVTDHSKKGNVDMQSIFFTNLLPLCIALQQIYCIIILTRWCQGHSLWCYTVIYFFYLFHKLRVTKDSISCFYLISAGYDIPWIFSKIKNITSSYCYSFCYYY